VKSIAVVNPGVDTRFFVDKDESAREVRSRLGLHNNLVMLSIGRLVERKGHDVALRAFARVLEDHPDLRYVVAGDGPERDRLGRIAAQEGIEPYVVFCGSLPDTALPAYYAMADFFIMVSRHLVDRGDVEGFGIVYLEANAAGLPVIAGRSGGSSDAVEHGVNGLLIDDPLSVEEIARAISSFCDDTEGRQRLGRQGKERARRFAWTHQQRLWRRSLEAMV
jgi:phosphatidylinositol alpha-1,6-mannosyltransferase